MEGTPPLPRTRPCASGFGSSRTRAPSKKLRSQTLIAWLPALAGEASGVLINNTPISKEREMSAENKIEWTKLLEQAISEPGKINEAYRRFHGYSLGNRLWAMCQCVTRGIEPSPLASFNRWKELGRHVKKGERALSLCMPVT